MASEIARLLNSSKSDTEKLTSLLDEYLLTNEDDSGSTDSDRDIQLSDSGSDDEIEIDLRNNDYDNAIIQAMAAPEIVLDDDLEQKKAHDFR